MRLMCFLLSLILISGCATTVEMDERSSTPKSFSLSANVARLNMVQIGMSLAELEVVMGKSVTIGFEGSLLSEQAKPLTILNPYKVEIVEVEERPYEVLYYFMRVIKSDGVVSDDELAPVVLDDGFVIGKGWEFLVEFRK